MPIWHFFCGAMGQKRNTLRFRLASGPGASGASSSLLWKFFTYKRPDVSG
jgi:hypothetical protein